MSAETGLDAQVIIQDCVSNTPHLEVAGELAMRLCYDQFVFDGEQRVFAEHAPRMLEHGVRQAHLARSVLSDPAITARLPDSFDTQLFTLELLIDDSGMTGMPSYYLAAAELPEMVPYHDYHEHPQYGFSMALNSLIAMKVVPPEQEILWPPPDNIADPSQLLALRILRHHEIQSRRPFRPVLADWGVQQWASADQEEQQTLKLPIARAFDLADDLMRIQDPRHQTAAERLAYISCKFNDNIGGMVLNEGMNLSLAIALARHGDESGIEDDHYLRGTPDSDRRVGLDSSIYRPVMDTIVRHILTVPEIRRIYEQSCPHLDWSDSSGITAETSFNVT